MGSERRASRSTKEGDHDRKTTLRFFPLPGTWSPSPAVPVLASMCSLPTPPPPAPTVIPTSHLSREEKNELNQRVRKALEAMPNVSKPNELQVVRNICLVHMDKFPGVTRLIGCPG